MNSLRAIAGLCLPWMLERGNPGHVVFRGQGKSKATDAINGLVGQILRQTRPGAARFLFLDSASIGRSFSSFAALGDASRETIYGKIATNAQEVRGGLQSVRNEIASITTDKLRQEHASLDAYNASVRQNSGAAGEPYRFVIIADWPHGFDAESCHLLQGIIEEGARCGTYVLASWDASEEPPHPYRNDPLKIWRGACQIEITGASASSSMLGRSLIPTRAPTNPGDSVVRHAAGLVDSASAVYTYETMIKSVLASKDGPYAGLSTPWSKGASAGGLVIPLGVAGGARIESMEIGRGSGDDRHHALIVGNSGSGKSNLIQVMVLALAELYSPEELSLYLVDLKGSETFGAFVEQRLPHVRVVAVESDPAFGISVLIEVGAELERRRRYSDIEKYRHRTGETIPRIILIIDEFQKLFDGISKSEAAVNALLNTLAREGRSFGIHLVFATQTLAGFGAAKSAIAQFAWRIAVGPSTDSFGGAFDSLGSANPLLATLSKRFAILNSKKGDPAGNSSKVQLAKIPDEASLTDRIKQLQLKWNRMKATSALKLPAIHVFKGRDKVDIKDSTGFLKLFEIGPSPIGKAIELPLGEPIEVAETVRLSLSPERQRNLLLLAPRADAIAGTVVVMLLSALVQRRQGELEIDIFGPVGSHPEEVALLEQLEYLESQFHEDICLYKAPEIQLEKRLAELELGFNRPAVLSGRPPERILVILGSHKLKPLQTECQPLVKILQQGPEHGMHVLCWSASVEGIKLAVTAYGMPEFGLGAVGQRDETVLGKSAVGTGDPNRLTVFGKLELLEMTEDDGKRVRAFAPLDQRTLQYVAGKILEKRKRSTTHV